ncbi:MAG TPA: superoxide dismutase [Anaerolineales bacterium]|nr:superoxide dismutase [Anaerolineales bacterium]
MPFELPPLPYAHDALEPHIDARTMEIHHGKHHAAYVNNLNAALEGHPNLLNKGIEDLVRNLDAVPEAVRTAVRNNGGGHANHSMFWTLMGPGQGGAPKGDVAKGIDKAFNSFEAFKEAFAKAAMGRFGSGWAWLVTEAGGGLKIVSTGNQDTPVSDGQSPVLGLDVWEHAYYLKYQNRRADYVSAWWNVVNWGEVDRLYRAARG